ncbi:MAG: DNA translocase FtsK 4TM domain-containing protein, partial [Lysobacterales bacterium]
MAKTSDTPKSSGLAQHLVLRLRESAFIILAPLAIYLLIALITYDPADPGWSNSASTDNVSNSGGVVGAWLADIGLLLFGFLAFGFPVMLAWWGWLILCGARDGATAKAELWIRLAGFALIVVAGSALAHLHFSTSHPMVAAGGGGIIGATFGDALASVAGALGSTLVCLALFLSGITLFTGLSWLRLTDRIGAVTLRFVSWTKSLPEAWAQWREGRRARRSRIEVRKADTVKRSKQAPRKISSAPDKVEKSTRAKKEKQMPLFTDIPSGELPPLHLLDEP